MAIYSTELYAFLKRHNITIRLPPEVPAGVARSFEILLPVLAIILTLHPLNLFIEAQLGMIIPEAIMSLVKPLVAASDTLPAILLSVLVCQVLWFAGIHGALIVTGIMNPFWMANLSVNQAAMAAGTAIPHIYVRGLLGSLSADRRRRLHPAAGADAAAQQGRASADDRPDGGRAGRI